MVSDSSSKIFLIIKKEQETVSTEMTFLVLLYYSVPLLIICYRVIVGICKIP